MTSLFIVEDEGIVAEGLRVQLEGLGYEVKGTAYTGEEALQLIPPNLPDIVMMDIMLGGELDGIQVAAQLRKKFRLPVIFLSAYSDRQTVERACATEPFGYLVKPYREQELRTTIETTLYKFRMEAQLRQQKAQLDLVLNSIEDGVAQLDAQLRVTYLNPAGAALVGNNLATLQHKPFTFLLPIDDRIQLQQLRQLLQDVICGRRLHGGLEEARVLVGETDHILLQLWVSPLNADQHGLEGCVITFRDVSQRSTEAAARDAKRRELCDHLTPRELEVLQLIVNGRSTKDIAEVLQISARTVEAHRRNIFSKFEVHDIPTLIRFSLQHHLVSLSE